MTRKRLAALPALAGLITVVALVGGGSAFGDPNGGCNNGQGTTLPSTRVGATATDNGDGTVDYTFESFVTEGSGGIPGLIEYCVISDTQPTAVTVDATGANGAQWGDPAYVGRWSFDRPDGDPSNIPYDGQSNSMGTATYGTVPNGFDNILLHINDPSECSSLYGQGTLTCFVLPGSPQTGTAQGPTVSKDASGSYDDTYKWTIAKDACLDGTGGNTGKACVTTVKQIGGTAKFNYTVTVTHGASQDSNVKVAGTVTVTNPNSDAVAITGVTDKLSDGTVCTITDTVPSSLPSGDTTLKYECALSAVPSTDLTNTATVSWNAQTLDEGPLAQGSNSFTYPLSGGIVFTATEKDTCVTVVDDNATPANPNDDVTLGTHCISDGGEIDNGDGTFSYSFTTFSRTYNVPANDCTSYENTAKFTTNDTKTTGSDDATVTLCGPAKTGALTIGFWKNTNGQNLIKTYCQNPALANYLTLLGGGSGPFSNAPTTSCSSLATYVSSILIGASATDMNKMLKAQMLGTALDVWFSGPGWTSTKIGSVKPPSNFLSHNNLGTFNMDTTAVCPMVDNLSTGTATCKNSTPSTDAVAAGAVPSSPMSMQAILDFAATTPSPFNGSTSSSNWYAGNRTKQEILKNIFDQFNNQLAFGSF